ncbi:MAG: ROK family protein, partial [Mariprofundaceae bacterium]
FALAEQLGARLKISVAAQNDALCAALGEARFGVGLGRNNLMHITLGTGVGGGLILHKHPYTGENGMAMEFGHLRVDYDDAARTCGCGGSGCVEAYASASAIADRYAALTGKTSDSAAIYAAACRGDKTAIRVLEDAGMYLGRAIAEAVKLLDVETISISGGLTGAWELFQPALMQEMDQRLIPPLKGKINVLRTSLDDRGGLLGAAALVQGF